MANDFSSNPLILDTVDAVAPNMGAPSQAAGGAFAAGNTFWVLTAFNADGESVKSNEVTLNMVLNNKATLSWTQIPGATGYRLYRSLVSGVYGATSKVNVSIGAVGTIDDTGAALIAGQPPATQYSLLTGQVLRISKLRWKIGQNVAAAGDKIILTDAAGKVKYEGFHSVGNNNAFEEDQSSDFIPPLPVNGLKLPQLGTTAAGGTHGKLYVYLDLGA